MGQNTHRVTSIPFPSHLPHMHVDSSYGWDPNRFLPTSPIPSGIFLTYHLVKKNLVFTAAFIFSLLVEFLHHLHILKDAS